MIYHKDTRTFVKTKEYTRSKSKKLIISPRTKKEKTKRQAFHLFSWSSFRESLILLHANNGADQHAHLRNLTSSVLFPFSVAYRATLMVYLVYVDKQVGLSASPGAHTEKI